MDPPFFDPLDPDPGYFFGGEYGDFHIIDQISRKPWYFFSVLGTKIHKSDLGSKLKADILSDMLLIIANK